MIMTESSVFTDVKHTWTAEGLGQRSGVSETVVLEFKQRYGASLPDDFAKFSNR